MYAGKILVTFILILLFVTGSNGIGGGSWTEGKREQSISNSNSASILRILNELRRRELVSKYQFKLTQYVKLLGVTDNSR